MERLCVGASSGNVRTEIKKPIATELTKPLATGLSKPLATERTASSCCLSVCVHLGAVQVWMLLTASALGAGTQRLAGLCVGWPELPGNLR